MARWLLVLGVVVLGALLLALLPQALLLQREAIPLLYQFLTPDSQILEGAQVGRKGLTRGLCHIWGAGEAAQPTVMTEELKRLLQGRGEIRFSPVVVGAEEALFPVVATHRQVVLAEE